MFVVQVYNSCKLYFLIYRWHNITTINWGNNFGQWGDFGTIFQHLCIFSVQTISRWNVFIVKFRSWHDYLIMKFFVHRQYRVILKNCPKSPTVQSHLRWPYFDELLAYSKCDSTYRKLPVVGRLDFELWGCRVKISQNVVPKSILRFHIFGIFNTQSLRNF